MAQQFRKFPTLAEDPDFVPTPTVIHNHTALTYIHPGINIKLQKESQYNSSWLATSK